MTVSIHRRPHRRLIGARGARQHDPLDMWLDLLVAFSLVVANGFFVASEFALARLRPTQVAELERQGRPGVRSLRHALAHLDAYLAACQLGITIASIGLGVVGESAFEELLSPWLGAEAMIAGLALAGVLAFAVITLLHVVIGELAPKSVAISRTTETALRAAVPMRVFYLATKPLVDLFNGLGNLLLRPFGIPPAREAGHAPHSEGELLELLAESREHGLIEDEEQELAERGFAFADRRAVDVMRPRAEIAFLTLDAGLEQAARRAAQSRHTRLPVCERVGGLDAPAGLVHAHDLLAAFMDGGETELAELLRPLGRAPASIPVTELLRRMRHERREMVLVTDEHDATVGLVTLEDLLEELVGEIEDEPLPTREHITGAAVAAAS
jgi:CBS domain containing-hemolysin-like protein